MGEVIAVGGINKGITGMPVGLFSIFEVRGEFRTGARNDEIIEEGVYFPWAVDWCVHNYLIGGDHYTTIVVFEHGC
ncbi:MAG: hypothetical protein ISS44_05380 [Candidatus Omnitrophica bacterium]|nr:hypothetical protein [Candidatus Omnitrophota bacterium]